MNVGKNYLQQHQVMVVKKDSSITTATDLHNKKGAVEEDSVSEIYGNGFEAVALDKTTFMLILDTYSTSVECLDKVSDGTAEFAIVDEHFAKKYCGVGDYANLTTVEALSSTEQYYAPVFEKGSELKDKVNAELKKLADDGTVSALAEKYGISDFVLSDF